MEIDEIKTKIKFAMDAVEDIDKDYKIEAFKIILSRELGTSSSTPIKKTETGITPMIRRLAQKGVRKRIDKIVSDIGLRPQLPPGIRRHEVQLDHGFRKYFNTMLRRAKVDYLDKEDMMGHKVGLEKHYERYQEEDFERFPEYQKAIPFLTISDEERIRLENEKLKQENTEKKQFEAKIKVLEQRQGELENSQKEYESIKPDLEKLVIAQFEELGEDFFKQVFGKKTRKN